MANVMDSLSQNPKHYYIFLLNMANLVDSLSQNPKNYSCIFLLDMAIGTNQFVHMSLIQCIHGCDWSFAVSMVMHCVSMVVIGRLL